jgi:hypothetical protein
VLIAISGGTGSDIPNVPNLPYSHVIITYGCCYSSRISVVSTVKVKLSLCLTKHHAMKAYWGSRGIAPFIL